MQGPPATIGMSLEDVDTPCLIVDLDAFDTNIATMAAYVHTAGVRLRTHAKTHKSADISRIQMETGGACGVCCQKVSEAEALMSAGVRDILISNEVVSPGKIDRVAALAPQGRILICVDDADNIGALGSAARRHAATIECLVEIDVGAGRCGVMPGAPAVSLAQFISVTPGLTFAGLQAYHGKAQHVREFARRKDLIDAAIMDTGNTVQMLREAGLPCDIIAGAGTGTYQIEGGSGVYNELQCGSYIFMDADYQRIKGADGNPVHDFSNSLFVYTSIMSKTRPGHAVCDAGTKAVSVDSGMPLVYGDADLEYLSCSDEHGVLSDKGNRLKLNDKIKLIPGHCDPTVNLYDWFVGVRNGRVEALWPVTARGMVS